MTTIRRPNRTCRTPGCPNYAHHRGRCKVCNHAHQAATPAKWGTHNPDYDRADYQTARARVLKRDRCCLICNTTTRLECHHLNHKTRDNRLVNLVTLCADCHRWVEREHKRGTPGRYTIQLTRILSMIEGPKE